MTDGARAEITNGIWLCRNCHKLVDTDLHRYSADVLFAWRATHDSYVTQMVGNKTDQIIEKSKATTSEKFGNESQLCQRIIRDRLPYWEYRLTAEALREHLKSPLRDWRDLSSDLYVRGRTILTAQEMFPWIAAKAAEASDIINALCRLYADEIKRSWGEPGVEGDPEEIIHVCRRLAQATSLAVQWEEEIRFVSAPEEFDALVALFRGALGRNIERIPQISQTLDDGIDLAETRPGESHAVHVNLVIDLPEDWAEKTSTELARVTRLYLD